MGWRRGLPLNRGPRRALGRPQPTPGKTMRGVALLLISLLMVLVPRAASAQEPPKPDVVKHAELTLKDIKVSAKLIVVQHYWRVCCTSRPRADAFRE